MNGVGGWVLPACKAEAEPTGAITGADRLLIEIPPSTNSRRADEFIITPRTLLHPYLPCG